MKLFLDREHTGTFVDAIINWTPEAANLSIFGVLLTDDHQKHLGNHLNHHKE